jgi:hypothetical protein
MSRWFTENPTSTYLVLATALLVCAIAFGVTHRVRYLLFAAAVVVLAGVVWLVDSLVITDREQVVRNTIDLARAVEEGNIDRIGQLISEKFYVNGGTGGIKRKELLDRAARALPQTSDRKVEVWDFEVEAPKGPPGVLECTCMARATGTVEGRQFDGDPFHLRLWYIQDPDGQWRLWRFEVWDFTGQRRYFPG